MSGQANRVVKRLKETKYQHIVAWGRYLSSSYYYIEDQIDLAEKENAPLNAIFKLEYNGVWETIDSPLAPRVRALLEDLVK